MIKIILSVLVVLVLGLVAVIALRPADFRIERSASLPAPPATVFEQVNDFHKWENWSPWAKLDPTMQQTYTGPTAGQGASYHWVGNNQVGEGRMTITESRTNEFVAIRLEFIKPFAAVNTTEFTFKPEGTNTLVTWAMHGKNGFMSKAFDLFMNMDKTIGRDFENGLEQMKTAVGTAPKK